MTSSFDIHDTQTLDYADADQSSEKNNRDLIIVIGAIAVVILSLLLVTLMFFGKRKQTATTPATQQSITPAARIARTDLLIRHMNDNFSLPKNNISLTAKKIKDNTPVIVPAHLEHFVTLMDIGADLYCADLIDQQRFEKAFDDIITATCRNDQVAAYASQTISLPNLCQTYIGNVGIGRFGNSNACKTSTPALTPPAR